MKLNKKELNEIKGGASATFFNAFARVFKTMYDIGYDLGSSLRRILTKKTCKI